MLSEIHLATKYGILLCGLKILPLKSPVSHSLVQTGATPEELWEALPRHRRRTANERVLQSDPVLIVKLRKLALCQLQNIVKDKVLAHRHIHAHHQRSSIDPSGEVWSGGSETSRTSLASFGPPVGFHASGSRNCDVKHMCDLIGSLFRSSSHSSGDSPAWPLFFFSRGPSPEISFLNRLCLVQAGLRDADGSHARLQWEHRILRLDCDRDIFRTAFKKTPQTITFTLSKHSAPIRTTRQVAIAALCNFSMSHSPM